MNAVTKQQETLPTKIEAYTPTALALADLSARYSDVVFSVATPAGMKQAKEARAEIKGYRVDLEKTRVAIKADALEQCRLIDSEAKRIKDALDALEGPINQQIKAEEQRKEQERIAAEKAEMERIQCIQQSIIDLRNKPAALTGKPSAEIRAALDSVTALEITEDRYAEFIDHAQTAKNETMTALARLAEDAERLEAERAELERLREEAKARAKEEAARKAEEQRLADEQRAREQAELQKERERLAKERAEHEANVRAEAEQRAREEAERKAEQDRIEAEKRAREEAARKKLAEEQAELDRQREAIRREEERAKAEAQRREQQERERIEREAYAQKQQAEREAYIREMEDEIAILITEINAEKITTVEALRLAYKSGANAEKRRHA